MEAMAPRGQDMSARFVQYVVQRCNADKGLAARLRRADNPATEYQSWEVLARFGVDLDNDNARLRHAAIAAAIARSKTMVNGQLLLGAALARCFSDGSKSDQAQARLRRLLACDDTAEVCQILRPMLSLIASRVGQPLNFAVLLNQLRWFDGDPQRTKATWAQSFYRTDETADEVAA